MSYRETQTHNLSLDSYALCSQSYWDSDGQIIRKKYNLKPIPMASQVHINSLNESLNFKPWFENLKPRFKNFKPRLKTLNVGLKKKSAHLFFKQGF